MDDLNQFAISKILGSKIKQIAPVGFGNFSSVSTTEEIQKALRRDGPGVEPLSYTYEQDAVVVQAFDDVREGAPTDELLWNKDLAKSFVNKCRELALNAPNSYLIRRLINGWHRQTPTFPTRRATRTTHPFSIGRDEVWLKERADFRVPGPRGHQIAVESGQIKPIGPTCKAVGARLDVVAHRQ